MTTDLAMLAATAILTALLVMPYGLAMWTLWPVQEIVGNRDAAPPPLPAWAERAQRAQRNMLENFPHFAVLVLIAHLAGVADRYTAIGASVFFCARVVHAIVYIAGVWRLRAPAFFAAWFGECLIIFRLFGWTPAFGALVLTALIAVTVIALVLLRRRVRPAMPGSGLVAAT